MLWGVSSSQLVSIIVYLAGLLWFSTHAFHGLERARPWAMGLDTSNITQIHIHVLKHSHANRKYTIRDYSGPVGSEKEHSCKRFEPIDWENKFPIGGYLFPRFRNA